MFWRGFPAARARDGPARGIRTCGNKKSAEVFGVKPGEGIITILHAEDRPEPESIEISSGRMDADGGDMSAELSANGVVTARSAGQVIVTAYTYDKKLSDQVLITIVEPPEVTVEVSTDLVLWGDLRKVREAEVDDAKKDVINNYKPGLGGLIDFFVPRFARMQTLRPPSKPRRATI